MRDKVFDKLVEAVTANVVSWMQGAHGVCYACGESVLERVEKLEQKVANGMPIVDDVVRCVDCRWWSDKNGGFCDILGLNINDEEFFCAWGERRKP